MLKQINIFIEMIICVTVDSKSYSRHLCQPESLFLIKLQASDLFLKIRLWHKSFPVVFAKFLRTLFLQKTSVGYFCRQGKAWVFINFQGTKTWNSYGS